VGGALSGERALRGCRAAPTPTPTPTPNPNPTCIAPYTREMRALTLTRTRTLTLTLMSLCTLARPVSCSSHPSFVTSTHPALKKPLGLSVPPMKRLPLSPVSYCG
jgi:hypothetical protein